MRILLATNALWPADKEGGPAFSNFYLAQSLAGLGNDVRVVTTDRNGPERLRVERDRWTRLEGVEAYYATTRRGSWIHSPSYARTVFEASRDADVSILSGIFWNHTGLAAWRACRSSGVPYVTMPRGLLSPWALAHKGMKKRVYWSLLARRIVTGSSAIIALAEQEARDVAAAGLDVPVSVIPNGAHLDGLDTSAMESDGRPYLLFLSRVHAKKGLDLLIPAFARIAPRHPDLRLVIAGTIDPAFQDRLDSLIRGSGVSDRLELVGNVSGRAKASLLVNATAFALTSYSEGLPVAVLEALAAGVPVVVTRGCNLPEVAEHRAGFLVADDPADVALALDRLAADPTLREELGRNARALAKQKFSWSAVGHRVQDLLTSCVAAREKGRGR